MHTAPEQHFKYQVPSVQEECGDTPMPLLVRVTTFYWALPLWGTTILILARTVEFSKQVLTQIERTYIVEQLRYTLLFIITWYHENYKKSLCLVRSIRPM